MSDNTISPENMLPPDGEESKKIHNIEDKGDENPENQFKKEEIIPEKEDLNDSQNIQNKETEESEKPADKTEEEPLAEEKVTTPIKPRIKDTGSNYQISLINQNLLKVDVSTKSGVKINSVVKVKDTTAEKQNNEIYLYPKFDRGIQEISVMISIDEDVTDENYAENENTIVRSEDQTESGNEINSKSNYQINLINENLLKIRIETPKGVKIDSVSRDKRTNAESQTNKIHLNPVSDEEIQIVEITIEIDLNEKEIILPDGDGNFRLIPNPEVVDLIQPPTYPVFDESNEMYEIYDTDGGYKNPFDALRKLIQKNTAIGITVAVIIHLLAAGIIFFNISKKSKDVAPEEQSRLFIIQDLPDPKIKLENVEDPNKPPVEETPPEELKTPEREITPRKIIRPPVVSRPDRDKEEEQKEDTSLVSSDLTRELDSLRKLVEEEIALMDTDSTS
ncbi:MAG TPA: hypothetical protein PKD83_12285, partial [Ignavibacteria bacterium]|nr:hypothetical protein [Ignavibacteria bacterium]